MERRAQMHFQRDTALPKLPCKQPQCILGRAGWKSCGQLRSQLFDDPGSLALRHRAIGRKIFDKGRVETFLLMENTEQDSGRWLATVL